MVFGVLISLSLDNYAPQGSISLPSIVIGLVDLVLLLKCKVSIPVIICFIAGLGLILFGALGIPMG